LGEKHLTDELVLHGSGLDQPIPVSDDALSEIYEAVDGLIEKSVKENDPETAIAGGRALIEGVQLRGVALMRLLYKLYLQWARFGLTETFEDRIYDEWGLSKSTIQRYINIWRAVFDNDDVPKALLPALAEKPVNTLARLVRPVNENKLVVKKDWKKIAEATDDSTVRRLIKDMAGTSKRGRPALQFHLYPDGKLYVVEGQNKELLALVKCSPKDLENKLLAKGYERLRNGTGAILI
jgi:hypothetical protein